MRLIDADALVEWMEHGAWDWETVNGIETKTALRQVISDIKNQPTADVQEVINSAWIPVSERLPEENGEYFAKYINHDYEHIKGVPLTAPVVYYYDTWFWWSSVCLDMLKEYGESHADDIDDAIEIIAWMPMPEL